MSDPGDSDRKALRRAPITGDVVAGRQRRPVREEIDEGPSAEDIERFDNPTRACPECGKEVYDDVAVCYHCGHALARTSEGSGRAPKWVWVVVAVLLIGFVVVSLRGIL